MACKSCAERRAALVAAIKAGDVKQTVAATGAGAKTMIKKIGSRFVLVRLPSRK